MIYNNDFEISSLQVKDAINNYKGATDTYGSSKPNTEKEKLKNILKKELIEISQYKRAERLYSSII